MSVKPRLIPVGDGTFIPAPARVPTERLPGETPRQYAARRFGKPFAHEHGSRFAFNMGPSVLTAEHVAALKEENEKRRGRK